MKFYKLIYVLKESQWSLLTDKIKSEVMWCLFNEVMSPPKCIQIYCVVYIWRNIPTHFKIRIFVAWWFIEFAVMLWIFLLDHSCILNDWNIMSWCCKESTISILIVNAKAIVINLIYCTFCIFGSFNDREESLHLALYFTHARIKILHEIDSINLH